MFCGEEELLSLDSVPVLLEVRVLVLASPCLVGSMSPVKVEMVVNDESNRNLEVGSVNGWVNM